MPRAETGCDDGHKLLLKHLANHWPQLGEESRRLLHGRGRTLPGLEAITVDWFAPVLFITQFAPVAIDWQAFQQALVQELPQSVAVVLLQRRHLPEAPSECLFGELSPPYYASRAGLRFDLQFGQQQNLGFFLDMEPGRRWLERQAAGKRVLNLFAFTCAFSVVALSAGASSVVNVDMSSAALNRGRSNHSLNGLDDGRAAYLKENILKSWGRIRRKGPYDIIIFDPPSFQRGSFVAAKDYAKLIRRIPELAAEQAEILSCLNAPELMADFIPGLFAEDLPQAELIGRLPGHPDFPDAEPERALKLFHYHYRQAPTTG
ncbi:class I SAM-dependent methyltransferase [Halioxenophilus sp. WMMB6]|uniref:class I SAM-dependent methyltransferase n=1 Tax=Halioxenophilus sp. WMMB6 TaxID=3073815 RepID=UPI00295E9AC5|nr:class I SAM-dependent methyltransferase [Halioxenophilus sp. WMMB6]